MLKHITKYRRVEGFTLLEMSIVLAIIGMVAAGLLVMGNAKHEQNKFELTVKRLNEIETALFNHKIRAEYLPCPADPSATIDSSTFGVASDCSSSATGSIVTLNSGTNEEIRIGVLPTRALNLPDEYMFDGWGNRLTYAVVTELAKDGLSFVDYATSNTNGVIQIQDAAGNQMTEVSSDAIVSYVVVSHGKDGKGAYNKSGSVSVSCSTTSLDKENCDGDAVFIDTIMNDGDVDAKYFDDIVRWELFDETQLARYDSNILGYGVHSSIVAAGFHSCAIDSDGRMYCWGDNTDGQLGDGTTTDRIPPTPVSGGYTDWISLSGGQFRTCGIREGGKIYCWGDNWAGQLGDGTTTQRKTPTLISGDYIDWTDVHVAADHTCALRNNGVAYCWGYNVDGRLGDGTTTDRHVPTLIAGNYTDWTDIAVGSDHTCGIRDSGKAYCWGDNSFGQLGDGTTTNRSSLTLVSGGYTDWVDLDAGESHTCGVRSNGEIYCWGKNLYGQLGDGTTTDRHVPTLVSGGYTDWTVVEAGGYHSCGLRETGEVYCWGGNWFGEVGDGTVTERTSPVSVSGGYTDWTDISAAGYAFTCGMRNNKEAYCWGYNNKGQLGDGTTTNSLVPVSAANSVNF